jgi:glutamine cyclotransferase
MPQTVPTSAPSPTPGLADEPPAEEPVPIYSYKIVGVYPHDRGAYTQGLIFEDGVLYEGTGLKGRSSLRRVELETGQVQQLLDLPQQFFGEGITLYGDKIYQLTWKENTGFIYDRESFEQLGVFHYPTQGWGLTHDGQHLIMSDGTPTLHFLDPETVEKAGEIQVHYQGAPVNSLNELEYVEGQVYAHVYRTDLVVRIDPQTGEVVGVIDLAGLLEPEDLDPPVDVLNGIAYDEANGRLFVTGKLWPKLFEIELVEMD